MAKMRIGPEIGKPSFNDVYNLHLINLRKMRNEDAEK